ncbi:ABC transporter permease subunit [Rhizobiales bacterium TNE-4]|nr:ABC transporter permease subunit [Rhizobiales bacterium TNE-4]MBV1827607.1 ABC transporter permease subunit [Rhizobiales bacterium TNE-4]
MITRWLNDKTIRGYLWQAAVLIGLVVMLVFFVRNASENMVKAGIASGFDFLWRSSGIDVPFDLSGYSPSGTIFSLFWAGVVNTLFVSALSIILATVLGFLIGLARLSSHWLLSSLAGAYVEFVRNIPLLFFVVFWYFGVIASLPQPKDSVSLFGLFFLNNRGLTVPRPIDGSPFIWAWFAIIALAFLQWGVSRYAAARRAKTGTGFPSGLLALVTLGLAPVFALMLAAFWTGWDVPVAGKFNLRGGTVLIPEFVALLAALVTYSAGFIAEIVRGGLLAVSRGQREAASALGLSHGQTLWLVVIPQAMRVMIPPMTSQYLNILKNSSFGAAIAYPELVSVFMGSALNNTGQAIEIIAMVLAVYLFFGLIVSFAMNVFNSRMALVTR